MKYVKFVVNRAAQTLITLFLILTILFFLFRMLPGDYTSLMLLEGADQESVEAVRKQWGLDQPVYVQYFDFLINMIHLDAGISLRSRTPVVEFVRMKIFNSFILVAPAITFAYILGSITGTILGSQRGNALEKHGLVPIISMSAFPEFFMAIFLVIIFSLWLGIFPTSGMVGLETLSQYSDAPWWRVYFTKSFLMHYSLPFLAVVMKYWYLPTLIMRTSVVETLGGDFYQYHKITGINKFIRLRQLARHSILPVITIYPISMTRALGGLVLIEVVFNWPGIGFTLVQAISFRDIPVVQFILFLTAASIVIANFGIDILYTVIDPRIDVEG